MHSNTRPHDPTNQSTAKVSLEDTQPPSRVAPAAVPESAKPKSKSRLRIVMLSAVIVVLLIVVAFMSIFAAVFGVTSIGCLKREKMLESESANLRQQLEAIKSPSYEIVDIDAYPNGNCRTGNGARGYVTLQVPSGTVAAVYKKVMSESFQVPNPDIKDLKISMIGGEVQIGGMQTEVNYKGQKYTVRFDMPKPIECIRNDLTKPCGYGRDLIKDYDLYNQPVDKIIILSDGYIAS